jgi:radical SAM family RiPP maturation amino acid epimerase
MARVMLELGEVRAANLVHPPLCVELSDGCTVGCWFCGISAERFAGNFEYTEENGALWRGVLATLRARCGDGVGQGFCYWATDPLDNPDYERFICDFHDAFGVLPQTTTAQPLKDVARTRRLLELSRARGGRVERFSVLSAGVFERILTEFTPEELLNVELIPQFSAEASPKALAGSSRRRAQRQAERAQPVQGDLEDGGTIACVSGLLINMPRRTVKLISPCSPCERWPLGYITFASASFDDAADLRAKLDAMFEAAMPLTMRRDAPVRLVRGLEVEPDADALVIRSRHVRVQFQGLIRPDHLASALGRSASTAGMLAAERLRRFGIPAVDTLRELTLLRSAGVLCEEPAAAEGAAAVAVAAR